MSVILGINAFHAGASAAIIVNGKIVAAIAEERLNRKKYFAGFPAESVRFCLKEAGLTLKDVDHVALGRDSSSNLQQKMTYALKHPLMIGNLLKIKASRTTLDDIKTLLIRECVASPEDARFEQVNVEHHLAHLASAFFLSGWDHAAGITIDGSGDFVSCMMAECKDNEIRPLHRIFVPNSLGYFYNMICQFIGYTKYGDEGKVMGLAPLGKNTYREHFQKMVTFDNGQLNLNPKFFMPFGSSEGLTLNEDGEMQVPRLYSDHLIELFGPARDPKGEITQRDMDLAFGLQNRFEEIYMQLLNHLHGLVPTDKVVMAGGCALNSVANGKIFSETAFKKTWIQPAAGDEGLALGSALYVSHCVLKEGKNEVMETVYLGGSYSNDEIEVALKEKQVKYQRVEGDALIEKTATEIAKGQVVGWFQGRSEWGPRALGNRSILCHPGFPGMKDILNARIKRRESFRPFAPAVLAEKQNEIFEHDHLSPYMLHVYKIRPEWREKLTAVNHVDDTGRLQSVARHENPLYYDLIKSFGEKTGTPVLLNTSFNENEPVVERPEEAIDCFLRTRMDSLVIGNFFCTKT